MVTPMRSDESRILPVKPDSLAVDFVLPVFDEPMKEHWPSKMSWSEAMRFFAPAREHYMRHFDSPEKRLREKNPEPFRMP